MTTKPIQHAAVLGSGVMGSAIAAHLAGAGIRTHLLDMVPKDATDLKDPSARNAIAAAALKRSFKQKPAPFFDRDAAQLIRVGNFDDDLHRLNECDIIIEAIVENIDIKRSLFERIAPHVNDTAILASNTSGLSLEKMNEVLPKELRSRFLVLHFFNPVRYMHLLEIVPGPATDTEVLTRAKAFGEFLGKGVVFGKDTANFVANRVGIYGLMSTIHTMLEDGLSIEEVDKIVGTPMARAKSAAFKTADIVGIDTLCHVSQNCYDALPDDEERDIFKIPEFISTLVKNGDLGRKSGAGFYKKQGKDIAVLDAVTGEYRAQQKVRYDSLGAARNAEDTRERLHDLVRADDKAGQFAWKVLARTLIYAANRMGEIADDIVNIDRAMRWGFNWDLGPFESWDAIGLQWSVERMRKEGLKVPAWVSTMLESGQESFYDGNAAAPTFYDGKDRQLAPVPVHEKTITIAAAKADQTKVVKDNFGATLIDLGDGCLGLEFHTKLNTIDNDVVDMLHEAITEAETNFEALVIGNDGAHFCAGANIMMVFMAAQQGDFAQIENVVKRLQDGLQALRYAHIPTVAAPFQYTFGGGAEVVMACDAAQAHAETYMGLVEVGVGLVPAGGGCLRVVERFTHDITKIDGMDTLLALGEGSLNIAMAKVGTGAEEARRLRYLRDDDGISLNRDFLLYEAKARALGMAKSGYRPKRPLRLKAAGVDAAKTIEARIWGLVEGGFASDHDALIARKIAHILCGGTVAAGTVVTEQHYLDLEREAFLSLCGEEKSQARIEHMLMKNKPLRN